MYGVQSVLDCYPDLSWDEIAARAGPSCTAPLLAPGEHPQAVECDAALYWPVDTAHALQEARPCGVWGCREAAVERMHHLNPLCGGRGHLDQCRRHLAEGLADGTWAWPPLGDPLGCTPAISPAR